MVISKALFAWVVKTTESLSLRQGDQFWAHMGLFLLTPLFENIQYVKHTFHVWQQVSHRQHWTFRYLNIKKTSYTTVYSILVYNSVHFQMKIWICRSVHQQLKWAKSIVGICCWCRRRFRVAMDDPIWIDDIIQLWRELRGGSL